MGFEDEQKFEIAVKPEEFLGVINIKILRPIFLLYKKKLHQLRVVADFG